MPSRSSPPLQSSQGDGPSGKGSSFQNPPPGPAYVSVALPSPAPVSSSTKGSQEKNLVKFTPDRCKKKGRYQRKGCGHTMTTPPARRPVRDMTSNRVKGLTNSARFSSDTHQWRGGQWQVSHSAQVGKQLGQLRDDRKQTVRRGNDKQTGAFSFDDFLP